VRAATNLRIAAPTYRDHWAVSELTVVLNQLGHGSAPVNPDFDKGQPPVILSFFFAGQCNEN